MYWTLFAVIFLSDGRVDYNKPLDAIAVYETRLECEIVIARILTIISPPPNAGLVCLRTDET